MGSIRLVTINTDASVDKRRQIGAFAYWIRCDSGKLFSRGELKAVITDPAQAELMAIVKAIHHLTLSNWNNIQRIIINTDCLNVIHFLKKDYSKISQFNIPAKDLQPIADIYFNLLKKDKYKDCVVEYRHVKAHVDVETARQYCNDWCDRMAKQTLNEMRNSLDRQK